jgi:hypothetical protein
MTDRPAAGRAEDLGGRSWSLRQQGEVGAVARADHREVAAIESGDPGLSEAFSEGDNRGVDEAEAQLSVGELQLRGPDQIIFGRVDQPVCTATDVGCEICPSTQAAELSRVGERGAAGRGEPAARVVALCLSRITSWNSYTDL